MMQDSDKPNQTYSTHVPISNDLRNYTLEPDITYQQHQNTGSQSYRQTTGVATPAPRYQSYYSTDTGVTATPPPGFHELEQHGTDTGAVGVGR